MKRSLLFLLLFFPSLGLAKYCPACLQTFQAQTTIGQANILYRWLDRTMSGKMPLKLSDTKRLFSEDLLMSINGKRVAMDARGAYTFFYTTLQQQKLLESRLEQVIVDENNVVLKYQFITERKRKRSKSLTGKYRTLAITMLHFKHHKVDSWWELRYTTRIKG